MISGIPTSDAVMQVGEVFRQMPLTRQHWKAGFALFFAFVIEGWEMMIVVLASPLIASDFDLSPQRIGSLMGAIYFGMIPGCLIWGVIVDRLGRKKALVATLASYGVTSLISAASPTYTILWGTRFVSGLALAGIMVSPFIHLEELLPVKSRGRGSVYLASGWPVGLLIAIGVTRALRHTNWHWILAVSSLAGLWALVVAAMVPESPYWNVRRGRPDLAKRTIAKLAEGKLDFDLASMQLAVYKHRQGSFRELFDSGLRSTTILQFVLNFTLSFGNWGLAAWLPILLAGRGLSNLASDTFLACTALFMFPGYFTASWLTARYGRKKITVSFIGLAALFGFLFARSATLLEMYFTSFGLYFFNQGAWGVWDTWMGELYPTEVRGVSYSAGLSMQRVANAIAPVLVGSLLARQASFAYIVSFIVAFLLVAMASGMFLRETEGEILQ